LKIALETLWQSLCKGQALRLCLEEAEVEAEVEVEGEGEEVEVEGNQLLSLHNNSSPSCQPLIYKS